MIVVERFLRDEYYKKRSFRRRKRRLYENRKDFKIVIYWINNNCEVPAIKLLRVPHDFIEMEIR
jgi:hypothetical protein